MKIILYTLFFITSINLIGQPTVGPDAIVGLGEEEPTVFLGIQEQNWTSGTSGENIMWDYSNLTSGEMCDYLAQDPMESPYFDSFPDSDIYFKCTFADSDGQLVEQHTYYTVDGNTLQLAGNVSISISNPSFDSIFIVYTDLLDWGTFPYSFEDMTDDSFEARITSYIGNQIILAIQNGTSTHEVDSYGTLTTPSGTYNNTLRVKRIELAENSIPGIPFSSPQESYRYTWYGENENGVLLNLDSIVIKDFNGNILNTTYSGSYRVAGPTMTSTTSIPKDDLSIYPNPTTEEINVEYPDLSNCSIKFYAVDGRELSFSIVSSTHNSCKIKIDHGNMNHTVGYLRITDKEGFTKVTRPIYLQN